MERYDFGTNCVCVGRVSTYQQGDTQTQDLIEFAKSLGFKKIKSFFTTESGFLEYDEKQGWNLVVDFFNRHSDYRVLICEEISRLSRVSSILMRIKEYLIANKIQLIIKDISFSLFNEWGEVDEGKELVFSLYASLANSEMRQKRERFKRGLKSKKELGYSIGGKVLFGYDRDYEWKDGKKRSFYRINEEQAKEIKTIYRWYAFGIEDGSISPSIRLITQKCIEMGMHPYLHSERNVNKCLKEEAYTGKKETHNRTKNPDYWNYKKADAPKYKASNSYVCTYPPIFENEDRTLFDLVQERLNTNQSKRKGSSNIPIDKSTKHYTILSKKIVCPQCGGFLQADYRIRNNHPSFSYRCGNCHASLHPCSFKHTFGMIDLDSIVWCFCRHSAEKMIKAEEENRSNQSIDSIKTMIANLESKIEQYDYRVSAEETIFRSKMGKVRTKEESEAAIAAYTQKLAEIEKERKGYQNRQAELRKEIELIQEGTKYIESISRDATLESDKRKLYLYVHKIVDRVDILYCDKYYTLVQVRLYNSIPSFDTKNSYYICIYKRKTSDIRALMINSEKKLFESDSDVEWDNKTVSFICGDKSFPLDYVCNQFFARERTYRTVSIGEDETMVVESSPLEEVDSYIFRRELKYSKLNCYAEDMKR